MNGFLRDNGYGVSLIIGVALLVIGILSQPMLLLPGVGFVLIAVIARPLEEFTLSRTSMRLKWQRDAAQAVHRRLEDSVEAKVTHGSGNVVVTPEPFRLRLRAFEPTVIVRPQSPDEFAETLFDRIIEPAIDSSAEPVNAATPEEDQPKRDAHPDA